MSLRTQSFAEKEYKQDQVKRIFGDAIKKINKNKLHFIQVETEEQISQVSQTPISFYISNELGNGNIELLCETYISFYLLFELRNKDEPQKLTKVFIDSKLGQIWLLKTDDDKGDSKRKNEKKILNFNEPGYLTEIKGRVYSDIDLYKILSAKEIHDVWIARCGIKNYIYETINAKSIENTNFDSLKENWNRSELDLKKDKTYNKNGYSSRLDRSRDYQFKRSLDAISDVERGETGYDQLKIDERRKKRMKFTRSQSNI